MNEFVCQPIGVVHSCFTGKFGIPRQPGLVPAARGRIELFPSYSDPQAFVGLDQCSHIWVQFVFHRNRSTSWRPRVRPPRMGGNQSIGLFATRSPNRPNPIGLSVVTLDAVCHERGQTFLDVSGIDLLDGSPVLDIKPYVPYVDVVLDARNAIATHAPMQLPVNFSECSEAFCAQYEQRLGISLRQLVEQVLRQDPRPAYQKPGVRIYILALLDVEVHWRCVEEQDELLIHVQRIEWAKT